MTVNQRRGAELFRYRSNNRPLWIGFEGALGCEYYPAPGCEDGREFCTAHLLDDEKCRNLELTYIPNRAEVEQLEYAACRMLSELDTYEVPQHDGDGLTFPAMDDLRRALKVVRGGAR